MKKVLLIGLDGGSAELIQEWRGDLPVFNEIIERGTSGRIRSTVPATTVPAWNAIYSGKNPGKLGIFDFVVLPFYRPHGLDVANYKHAPVSYLWDILTESSVDSLFMNIPIMYPPPKLKGVAVSGGIFVPLQGPASVTFPPSIKNEIDSASGGYEASPFMDITIKGKEKAYLARILKNIEKQANAIIYLVNRHPWMLMSYVFSVIDTAQHYFWHHYDGRHRTSRNGSRTQWSDALKLVYTQVDKQLGRILRAIPPDTNVLIVSDHGGGPLMGQFYVNEWLRSIGYLNINNEIKRSRQRTLMFQIKDFLVGHFPMVSERVAPALPKRFTMKLFGRGMIRDSYREFLSRVDWGRTKAYGLGGQGAIYVNLSGREPRGSVSMTDYDEVRNNLISELKALRFPNGALPTDLKIWKREELYWGENLKYAPDIAYVIEDNRYVQKADVEGSQIWGEAEVSGGHSSLGAFFAFGPDIAINQAVASDVSVYDILPTVLHLLNIPIPNDLDGKPLMRLFTPGSEMAERAPIYSEKRQRAGKDSPTTLTAQDELEIKRRLESLGYM